MDIEKLIEQLKDLEACAFGYQINGEVLGMDCSDFEQVMVDAADAIEELQAKCNDMDCQLEEFSRFLCNQTGGLLSKTNYSAETMISYAEDYEQRVCDNNCDLRNELEQVKADRDRWKQCAEALSKRVDELECGA